MTGSWWGSLRTQLALVGFVAIYGAVLLVVGVELVTDQEVTRSARGTTTVLDGGSRSPWSVAAVLLVAPVAAGVAHWWAGRASRPIVQVRVMADEIGATDLGRRIGVDRGPHEVVALAASFDRMRKTTPAPSVY